MNRAMGWASINYLLSHIKSDERHQEAEEVIFFLYASAK